MSPSLVVVDDAYHTHDGKGFTLCGRALDATGEWYAKPEVVHQRGVPPCPTCFPFPARL